ncbi:hypothetical protein PIB30_069110 [Stylosanthes scabra]|uniref:Uncharacterized protein n=1 Tax=Stylosanthes scabra TaxID=79078 RepID=A0ABU6VLI2_9FABA|nr:hypothetical protein [Stylosanthes scabra]
MTWIGQGWGNFINGNEDGGSGTRPTDTHFYPYMCAMGSHKSDRYFRDALRDTCHRTNHVCGRTAIEEVKHQTPHHKDLTLTSPHLIVPPYSPSIDVFHRLTSPRSASRSAPYRSKLRPPYTLPYWSSAEYLHLRESSSRQRAQNRYNGYYI